MKSIFAAFLLLIFAASSFAQNTKITFKTDCDFYGGFQGIGSTSYEIQSDKDGWITQTCTLTSAEESGSFDTSTLAELQKYCDADNLTTHPDGGTASGITRGVSFTFSDSKLVVLCKDVGHPATKP